MAVTQAVRKKLGAYYTPADLVELIAERTLADIDAVGDWRQWHPDRAVRVLDPACGDGRLLHAIHDRLRARGRRVELTGCDVDRAAIGGLATAVDAPVRTIHANALDHDWGDDTFDIVIGNPPYLSQMATATTRGGSSRHGGGPYADVAAEFLALAARLADSEHGRIALVLPQSILASRDAGPIRESVDDLADHAWSWWTPRQQLFDANVRVCALGFRRPSTGDPPPFAWTRVVTDRLDVPPLDPAGLSTSGSIGDRADLNANFRDEYYALVPAVADDADGPPLVTSGLIDPAICWWGTRPVRFNKSSFRHPRVDLAKLEGRFGAWAERKLVPKVLVANQTRVVEAVADPRGEWLPGVPVTTVTPRHHGPGDAGRVRRAVLEIEAVLCSPVASAWCWHAGGGTGLSTRNVRITPAVLADVPWPAGDLEPAIEAIAAGDLHAAGTAVLSAYSVGAEESDELLTWWTGALPKPAVARH
jgi:SAM-dependent methyltransferase